MQALIIVLLASICSYAHVASACGASYTEHYCSIEADTCYLGVTAGNAPEQTLVLERVDFIAGDNALEAEPGQALTFGFDESSFFQGAIPIEAQDVIVCANADRIAEIVWVRDGILEWTQDITARRGTELLLEGGDTCRDAMPIGGCPLGVGCTNAGTPFALFLLLMGAYRSKQEYCR